MHEKVKCHIDRSDYLHKAKDDIDDALYLAIKSHDLNYNKATMRRITTCTGDTGHILLQHFLDYDTPNQKQLTQVEFIIACDDEVVVDRVHVQYFKGKKEAVSVATA